MKWIIGFAMLGLSACALGDRHPRSGYQYDSEESATAPQMNLYQQRNVRVEGEAREELGLLGRSLSDLEQAALETRVRLKRQEAKLSTKREKKQYFSIRSALKNDRERLHFLSLPSFEAKERFAQTRGLASTDETYSDEVAKAIEGNDIALGMSQKAVMESWGDPDMVEIAGNQIYGIERWKYNRYVSGNEGYQKELRVVYFEGGRVVGWERP